jgi:hypothetical protein
MTWILSLLIFAGGKQGMTNAQGVSGIWVLVGVFLVSLAISPALAAVPVRPSNVTATSVSSSQINLTWHQAKVTNVVSYTIKVATNSAFTDAQNLPSVQGATTTHYAHVGLLPSQTYWYKIRANGSGRNVWSAWSTVASATTAPAGIGISPRFFGQNAWMPYQIGKEIYNGRLEEKFPDVGASGAKIMRYGGSAVDKHYEDEAELSRNQYVTMVDTMRTQGLEPLLQVPYNNGAFDATQAAGLVQHINITMGKNVQYWAIANEPDKYLPALSEPIAVYLKRFSQAMKAVDPTILITGPDLSWYDASLMDPLTTCPPHGEPDGEDDITGPIPGLVGANGTPLYYADIMNFHTYPFSGIQERDDVIAYPSSTFEGKLTALQSRLDACNSRHGRTGPAALKMAVTEINVNWRNPGDTTPEGEIIPGTNDLVGVGASSFLAGQFWAEIMSIGMKKGLEFIAFWSVIEGNEQGNELGYIKRDNTLLPTYHHFQMLAQHFRGVYTSVTPLVNGVGDSEVKAFGCKDGMQVAVMILNQKLQTSLVYTVRLNTEAVSGTNALKITIDAGLNREYSNPVNEPLGPQSTVLLVFDATGVLTQRLVYSLDRAQLQQGPLVTSQ